MPLQRKSEQLQYSDADAIAQDNRETKRSKKVPDKRSKNVPPRVRQSAFKDAKILKKISAFGEMLAATPGVSSLVAPHTPLRSPLNTPSQAHSNDNNIPVWALTDDHVKAVAATGALMIAERPAMAFTFNLTDEAIERAKGHPAGFLGSLKRSFDKRLDRAGLDLPYWFAIDITEQGRLHIHGAFLPPANTLRTDRKIREAMRDAWGAWTAPGDHKQISFKPLENDDWATYALRNRKKVAKIIGPHTFTVTRPLQRDAEWTYGEIRRIMRATTERL